MGGPRAQPAHPGRQVTSAGRPPAGLTSPLAHLGILAHSTEGAALAFLAFCQEGYRRTGRGGPR